MIGEVLGHYRVLSVLGQGGMGAVYEGEHALIRRKVAIKVLLPERSQNNEIVQRFFNEARASTLIHHPGIVDIIDFGYHASGLAYIVMEFLEGESLARYLAGARKVSPELAVLLLRQLASALGAAHRKGIVHRDLKPDNIFLVPDPDVIGGVRVKILDFGIAKLVDTDLRNSLRTRTGSLMGTPLYMSPEQCRGAGGVDHRSDVYSLGCIAYEMLCGRSPFYGEGMGDFIVAHISLTPRPLRALNPDVPQALEALVLTMLAKAPEHRPQSMDEVVGNLESLGLSPVRISRPITAPGTPEGVPSTLSGSASEIRSTPKAASLRWRFGIITALGTALGIGIGVFAVRRGPSAVPAEGTTPAAAPAPQIPGRTPSPMPAPAPTGHEPPESTPGNANVETPTPPPLKVTNPTVPDAGPSVGKPMNTAPETIPPGATDAKTPPPPANAKTHQDSKATRALNKAGKSKEATEAEAPKSGPGTVKGEGRRGRDERVLREKKKQPGSPGDNPVYPFAQ